mmetsp:Transcript_23479/g.51512  ORF Transcript_23479/g.51512 Transcript_23479/m.51512 type:complete len:220 (-) Transcript_23479:178-837(-)
MLEELTRLSVFDVFRPEPNSMEGAQVDANEDQAQQMQIRLDACPSSKQRLVVFQGRLMRLLDPLGVLWVADGKRSCGAHHVILDPDHGAVLGLGLMLLEVRVALGKRAKFDWVKVVDVDEGAIPLHELSLWDWAQHRLAQHAPKNERNSKRCVQCDDGFLEAWRSGRHLESGRLRSLSGSCRRRSCCCGSSGGWWSGGCSFSLRSGGWRWAGTSFRWHD